MLGNGLPPLVMLMQECSGSSLTLVPSIGADRDVLLRRSHDRELRLTSPGGAKQVV